MKTTKALPVTLLTAALMAFAAGASGQEIVPITATLPIKAVGDSCTELNLGTTANPNLIAAEGVAITADRASLLTCQSGSWAKQVTNGTSSVLYLEGTTSPPINCPTNWGEHQYREIGGTVLQRVCLSQSNLSCSIIYLRGTTTGPASCPVGWSEVDYKPSRYNDSNGSIRTCMKC